MKGRGVPRILLVGIPLWAALLYSAPAESKLLSTEDLKGRVRLVSRLNLQPHPSALLWNPEMVLPTLARLPRALQCCPGTHGWVEHGRTWASNMTVQLSGW